MSYKQFLNSSVLAKITFALLIIDVVAAFYILNQVFNYIGVLAGIIGAMILIIAAAGVWICHRKKTKAALIIEIILTILLAVGIVFTAKISLFIGNVTNIGEYETVQIVTLKDSDITADDDFSQYRLGYDNDDDEAYEKSGEILKEHDKTVAKSVPYKNTDELYESLNEKKVHMMVITDNTKSDLSVIDEEYNQKIKVIFEKKYRLSEAKAKEVDITTEPFTIYLCGTDLSSGDNINSTGRGDVNILLTVNPNTKKVNMQVIPRDTFVYISCRSGSSKLSYSGWWGGVQSSIESIENKFDIEINYYAKINFNGLVDLVDALGGVTVNSHYTYSYDGYSFTVGENFVDGEKALRFVRARKMLPENELSRGQHQMELIKGIFAKFAEEPTYKKSMAVIDTISKNFVTNLPKEDFYDAFKLIVKLLPELKSMENHSMKGEYKWHYDEIRPTYYQYYYYPAEGEVERIREDIENVKYGD